MPSLIVFFFVITISGSAFATDNSSNPVSSTGLGYIPSSVGQASSQVVLSASSGQKTFQAASNIDLPASYDLRNVSGQCYVSPVKNQLNLGTCWDFATYGSLESCLLRSTNVTYDFSENNMKNLLSSNYPEGFDRNWTYNPIGGNYFMSAAYLARWSGPVNESIDPYNNCSGISPSGLNPLLHVQGVTILPYEDYDAIKQALMSYGAVATYMYWDDTTAINVSNQYWNVNTASYYYNSQHNINHAVDIVGWDDNYSWSNFSTNPNYINGAFIVKNSWGTDFGQEGYFYVSYQDYNIARNNFVFNTTEPTTNYNKNYQYDPLGYTALTDITEGYNTPNVWCSNIFTSTGFDNLAAISSYFLCPTTNYHLYVYLNPTTDNPTSGTLASSQNGVLTSSGYITIKLNTQVPLQYGQKFSIVLNLTTPGYYNQLALEKPIDGYSSKANASTNQSFRSTDGIHWEDITSTYANTNICLKAFTIADGIYKVWQDYRDGNQSHIYYKNLVTGATGRVSNIDSNQTNPAVSGSIVVWQDNRDGSNWHIYYKNLDSGQDSRVTGIDSNQTNPAISGNIIVWQDYRNGNVSNIYYKNLDSGHWDRVTGVNSIQINPAVSGSIVVWQDNRDGSNWHIYYKNLDSGSWGRVTGINSNQTNPAVSGSIVVWQDNRDGSNWHIYYKNLDSGSWGRVTGIDSNQTNPAVSGSIVVWQDNRDGNQSHVYYKNLDSGSWGRVTGINSNQTNPSISGNTVIWQDFRDGNDSHIYYKNLDSGSWGRVTGVNSNQTNPNS